MQVKMQTHTRPHGFTLIELIIVLLCLMVLSGTVYGLITHVRRTQMFYQQRLDANETNALITRLWREDVSLASSIQLDTEVSHCTLTRMNPDAEKMQVEYAFDGDGNFTRMTSDDGGAAISQRTLARGCASGQFERVGRGVKLDWMLRDFDGIREYHWPGSVLATPLTQVGVH